VEYADVVERLMKNPAVYEALSESSYHYYKANFTWEQVAKKIRDFMVARTS